VGQEDTSRDTNRSGPEHFGWFSHTHLSQGWRSPALAMLSVARSPLNAGKALGEHKRDKRTGTFSGWSCYTPTLMPGLAFPALPMLQLAPTSPCQSTKRGGHLGKRGLQPATPRSSTKSPNAVHQTNRRCESPSFDRFRLAGEKPTKPWESSHLGAALAPVLGMTKDHWSPLALDRSSKITRGRAEIRKSRSRR